MTPMSIFVRAEWDPEARVFVATSEDVPGLVAEAATTELLMEKLKVLVPDLLALNGDVHGETQDMREIPIFVMHQHVDKIRILA
jgi:predicted RNase H-like HicB family nuclease